MAPRLDLMQVKALGQFLLPLISMLLPPAKNKITPADILGTIIRFGMNTFG